MPIPDAGPCARHPCDDCRACRSGRCCRRDNPDYRLPKLGEWEGPIHGALGVLDRPDGERVRCHACGESYAKLTIHALRSHDLTPEEYRSIFGFGPTDQLTGLEYSGRLADQTRQRVRAGEFGDTTGLHATREQMSAGAVRRTERTRDLGRPFPVREAMHRVSQDEAEREWWYRARGAHYLSPEQRAKIRALRPTTTAAALADRFGVSRGQIDVVCGRGFGPSQRLAERDREIATQRGTVDAKTVAARYGLTPHRVRQIWRTRTSETEA